MVTQVVIGQEGQANLNSSDLGQVDDFGQHSIEVTHSGSKSHRYNPDTNEVSTSGVSSYQAEETRFRNAQGNYSTTFDPEGSVELPGGIVTSAKVALRSGLVDATGNPTASNAPQQQQPGQEQQPESTNPHESFAMGERENAVVNDAIPENLSGTQVQVVSNQAIEGAVTGDFSKVVNSLVQNSGIDPAQASARVAQAYQAYADAGNRYLSDVVGMKDSDDRAAFYEWAQQQAPQALKGAIHHMVTQNNFRELGRLVGKWAEATPPSAEALQRAGYQVGKSSDGTETVSIPGFGTVAIRNAGKYL
jgi:hypothetical protein